MKISFDDLRTVPLVLRNITAIKMTSEAPATYDYESVGRQKNLIFLQEENVRNYYAKGQQILALHRRDVIFLPHGAHYHTDLAFKDRAFGGIGISFDLFTESGEAVYPDFGILCLVKNAHGKYASLFERLFFSFANPRLHALRGRGALYTLLDSLLSETSPIKSDEAILPAIRALENSMTDNLPNARLAEMCMMSESTFMRRFKAFSGGVTPVRYRNELRLMVAEELAASSFSLSEIAERVGFYDAAHLSKTYRRMRGKTLSARKQS